MVISFPSRVKNLLWLMASLGFRDSAVVDGLPDTMAPPQPQSCSFTASVIMESG